MQCTGYSGCFPLGKGAAIVRRYPCWFFFLCAAIPCFRNPPNYDMDYRIFNVRTFLCVSIHTGVGHTDKESAQHCDSEQLSQFFLVLRTGCESLVMESIGSRGRHFIH